MFRPTVVAVALMLAGCGPLQQQGPIAVPVSSIYGMSRGADGSTQIAYFPDTGPLAPNTGYAFAGTGQVDGQYIRLVVIATVTSDPQPAEVTRYMSIGSLPSGSYQLVDTYTGKTLGRFDTATNVLTRG